MVAIVRPGRGVYFRGELTGRSVVQGVFQLVGMQAALAEQFGQFEDESDEPHANE